ncbi:hypothetical protein DQG13_05945 [Paenibacillus sp. YN15]|nr:hypothetical protein DQG13_05945 [Paenibacillus sp. YN15]
MRLVEYEWGYDKEQTVFYAGLEGSVRLGEVLESIRVRVHSMMLADSAGGVLAGDRQKIHHIDRYIMEHLSENISMVSIAQHLYLNPSYFSRHFKKMTGINFTDYVHQFKMKIAIEMLRDKSITVEMLAAKLGYSDRTYFSKVFKKYNGVSPMDYKTSQGKQHARLCFSRAC